jgi:SAM-dependent methyltransferase
VSGGPPRRLLTDRELEVARRSRRHPRLTQFDYLHLRALVADLERLLAPLDASIHDVLDIYCGSRPYDDLLPASARRIGLDVEANPYGVADVVSDEFLPFEDSSFDLVTCFEAFQYVTDPNQGVREIGRVLRPGGTALLTVPFVWEYDRTILEHRYTGPELADLFTGWDAVEVVENGGQAVAWATLTGTIMERLRWAIPDGLGLGRIARGLFPVAYVLMNVCAVRVDALEQRRSKGPHTLPMNLLVRACRSGEV